MKLVAGLGNPGREYVGTRHNVGFDVIDRLACKLGATTAPADFDRMAKSRFDGLAVDAFAGSEKLLLLKPLTYMNLSGRSVQAAMAFYQLAPTDIMVVLDDLALACGIIRVRSCGSSGGHNGLKDIERALATSDYPRLRVGIDAPPPRIPGRDYVLGRFTEAQRPLIDQAADRAASAVIAWAENGITSAMNRFNVDERKGG